MATAEDKPRYFVAKAQKGGSVLHYWQPSAALNRAGFKTVPLSRNRDEAIREAEALNAKVDQWRGGLPVFAKNTHGTLPWLIEMFKQSPKWVRLRASTQGVYNGQFRALLRWSAQRGDPPMRTIARRDAEQFWASLRPHGPFRSQDVIKRCVQLWNYAIDLDEDIVSRNPFQRLGIPQTPPRSQVWQPGQIAAVVETALMPGPWGMGGGAWGTPQQSARPSIALAVIIAINTAQRPSDIRALRWSQYDGKVITLRQQKTRATVTIPVTEQLRIALDDAKRARTEGKVVALAGNGDGPIIINENTGRRYAATAGAFLRVFRQIARAAGIPDSLQFRDLRRTATTHLAEAGCTPHQIAAIGGWTVDTVAKMMAVYAPVNLTMAESAILKLEQYRSRQK
jgi:hypothetical protein